MSMSNHKKMQSIKYLILTRTYEDKAVMIQFSLCNLLFSFDEFLNNICAEYHLIFTNNYIFF